MVVGALDAGGSRLGCGDRSRMEGRKDCRKRCGDRGRGVGCRSAVAWLPSTGGGVGGGGRGWRRLAAHHHLPLCLYLSCRGRRASSSSSSTGAVMDGCNTCHRMCVCVFRLHGCRGGNKVTEKKHLNGLGTNGQSFFRFSLKAYRIKNYKTTAYLN